MNAVKTLLRMMATVSLLAAPISHAAVVDDLRVSQLEQEIRELQRLVQGQANRIDALEKSLRQARVNIVPAPERIVVRESDAKRWLDSANWDRIKAGMVEAEVLRLLGTPTSTRSERGANSQILFYAMELDAGGFLSGQVVLREKQVVEVQRPVLK